MGEARFTTLEELRQLMSTDVVKNQKINCIKLLRQITGVGLKEAKDFFEIEWTAFVIEGARDNETVTYQTIEDAMETKSIHERLSALEAIVNQLTRNETKKMAASIFTNEGE